MASYSDPFTGTSASLGANWSQISGTLYSLELTSDKARSKGNDSHGVYWNAGAFANDQYSQIIVGQTPTDSSTSTGPAVRIDPAGSYYYVWMPAGKIEIWKNTGGGSFSAVDQTNTSTVAAGDVIRFEAEGTTLRVIRNGTTIITKTDTSLSSGIAGIYGFTNNASAVSADSWAGGDLGATPIVLSSLTSGVIAASGSTVTTASITPAANSLVLAIIAARFTGGPGGTTVWSVSGNGLTWQRVSEVAYSVGSRSLAVFRAMGASPSSGAVIFTESSSNVINGTVCAAVLQITGVDTSGSDGSGAVGTPVAAISAVNTSPLAITITGTPAAGDITFAAFASEDDPASLTSDALWDTLHTVGPSAETLLRNDYDTGQDLSPTWTWSNAKNGAAIGFIIKASPPTSAFTFVAKNATRLWDAFNDTISVNLSGIAAGDLIVTGMRWDATDTTVSVSDGTSALANYAGANVSGFDGELYLRTFYLLASVASGTVTYTATLSAARHNIELFAFAYRYSGTASTDGAISAGGTSSTAVASGNITTTGTDEVAFGLHGYAGGGTVTSPLINGLAADQHQTTTAFGSSMWSRVFTSTFTGQASATLPSGSTWGCSIAAFKVAGAAVGQPTIKRFGGIPHMRRGHQSIW